MDHGQMVIDIDPCFQIDITTRGIKSMMPSKNVIMQFDHNSERFSFSMLRHVEGHDMLNCDRIEIHFINEDILKKEQVKDKYIVADAIADPDDSEKIKFTWLLSGNTSKLEGNLVFLIKFLCFSEKDYSVTYSWNTNIFSSILVAKGINNDLIIPEEQIDALASLETKLKAEVRNHADALILDHPDGSVTTDKIADNSITEDKILDGAVTGSKLDSRLYGKIIEGRFDGESFDADSVVVEGIYKLYEEGDTNCCVLIVGHQTISKDYTLVKQTKITHDGIIYTREFDMFGGEAPPEFEQVSVSQEELEGKLGIVKGLAFDGNIERYGGDDFDNMEFIPGYTWVYKMYDDYNLCAESGILMVRWGYTWDADKGMDVPSIIHQTKILAYSGTIEHRYSLSVEGNRATAWSEWESRYISSIPVADNAGVAGIIKLGRLNGLIIVNDMLVIDPATTAEIQNKHSTRKPITPTGVAYAVAMNTHQSLDDSYNPDNFQVVHSARDEATYFQTDKDKLPVSYKAVKEALANVSGGLKLITDLDLDWFNTGYSGMDVNLAVIDMTEADEFYGRFLVSSLNQKHCDGIFHVYINKSQELYNIEWETLSNKSEKYPELMLGQGNGVDSNYGVGAFGVWVRCNPSEPVIMQCHLINSNKPEIVSKGDWTIEEPFDGIYWTSKVYAPHFNTIEGVNIGKSTIEDTKVSSLNTNKGMLIDSTGNVLLKSPDGFYWKLEVDNSGVLSASKAYDSEGNIWFE